MHRVVVDNEISVGGALLSADEAVRPEDSASQAGGQESTVSSATSSALRLKARAAALRVQAEAMKQRHQMEVEEQKIRRRMEEHELGTQIAMVTAEAEVLDDAASQVSKSTHGKVRDDRHLDPSAPEWHPKANVVAEPQMDMNSHYITHHELLAAVNLPRTELMYFDGNPLEYWAFIRSFENTVEQVCKDDVTRLTRLLQYCRGKAKHVIQCCTVMNPSQGYQKARALLKERFGNNYVIAEAWVNRVAEGKPIGSHDKELLRDFADDLVNCEATLSSMNYLHEVNTQRVLVRIVGRLPTYLQNRWIRQVRDVRINRNRDATIHDLVAFVIGAAEEANDPVYSKLTVVREKQRGSLHSQPQKAGRVHSFTGLTERDSSQRKNISEYLCSMCGKGHSIFRCDSFKALDPKGRRKVAQEKGLCYNCLKSGHRSSECKLTRTCSVPGCYQKHTHFLHQAGRVEASPHPVESPPTETPSNVVNANESNTFTGAGSPMIALPLVQVRVWADNKNHFIDTYALLDNGSTTTFCTERLVKSLNINSKPQVLTLSTLGQTAKHMETSSVSLDVTDLDEQNEIHLSTVYTTAELPISAQSGVRRSDLMVWNHLHDVEICEASVNNVDLLIGQDNPEALVPCEVRASSRNSKAPFAVRTSLGWTVQGPVRNFTDSQATVGFVSSDLALQHSLERFWKLDSDDSMADEAKMSVDDRKVISLWEDSVTMNEGHYELPIPFSRNVSALANNRNVAERRLSFLQRKLRSDPDKYNGYRENMADMLNKGHAEKVPAVSVSEQSAAAESEAELVWYLPHHGVTNSHKPDKVRIVFDCAAKFQGLSLNDTVLQGPDLTNKLVGVLMRFREEPIALMADIESMYYQVKVIPHDRDVLRFLWWKDGDLNAGPEEFRMTVHPFGGVWSPSCANFALQRTAADNRDNFEEEAVRCIYRNFYVDDCLKSVASREKAVLLVKQLTELLACGGFRLTKWISNCREVLETIPDEDRAKQVKNLDMSYDKLPVERALGAIWDVETDVLGFQTVINHKAPTRRGILSTLSSVYDPLGFLSPYITSAKMIVQELCRRHFGWDERVPEDIFCRWRQWLEDLRRIKCIKIPRCIRPLNVSEVQYELHHFADASSVAYGTASYLRVVKPEGALPIACHLLMAKSRLAPLKQQTIPRLELMAATLAAKVAKMIQRELDISVQRTTFWTDSTIVLQYIRSENKRFHVFVANRIGVIHDLSLPGQWRHVTSQNNAADDITRGMNAEELASKERWWTGPEFLRRPEREWPEQWTLTDVSDDDPEVKQNKVTVESCTATKNIQSHNIIDELLARRSCWQSLKRDVAWILRFISFLRGRYKHEMTALSVSELEAAEKAIIRYIQRASFMKEVKALEAGRSIHMKSSVLSKLDPLMNVDGILCVGGRLRCAAVMPDQARYPMILPKRSHIVDLIVRHVHESHGHVGREHVLSLIHERYWILRGRAAVRRIMSQCVTCRRITARREVQKMANLPANRVTAGKPPFSYVGVDFFGPFMVKRGRSLVKRYGCIFTCMNVRAVHIEIVHSLETDSFINALQRFVCRRGQPEEICSDNGTNFVGAERELRQAISKLNSSKVEKFLSQKSIQWKFNPPSASHMGGVWERQIRSIRKVLSGLMKHQSVDDESLTTLLCLVESIINSRPLTTVSDDPSDAEPLTPNHLLLLRQNSIPSPGEFVEQDNLSRRRWRQVQYLADVFWRRWTREYLPTLQSRQKWRCPSRSLEAGDIVILVDDNSPRNAWQLGRVAETYSSDDGLVRTVKVVTKTATLIRPIHKLCLLESVTAES